MICPTHVNCRQAPSRSDEPKTLTGSSQKVTQQDAPSVCLEHADNKAVGVQAGTNSFVSIQRNMVNPTSRLDEAGAVARLSVEMAGKGSWSKRMPFCNRMDRSCNITPLRKQADFQQVVRHETAGRTFAGGNRK